MPPSPRDRYTLIAALSITTTVGYGILFYAFGVVLTPLTTELHATPTQITAAVTISTLVTAAAAVPVGTWLDRHGGRALMTTGSLIAAAAVAAWSQVTSLPGLYATFALIGLASAMTLYSPAFAVLVRHLEPSRHPSALLTVTIVAGLSTSMFTPLTGWLTETYGWRHTLATLAITLAAITLPLHALAVPAGTGHPTEPGHRPDPATRTATAAAARRDPAFWLLTAAFVANGVSINVIPVHLVSYLISLGHPPTFAATIAGLLGILSVTGRIVTTGLRRHTNTATVTAAVFTLQAAAIAALPATGTTTTGAVTCVALFGLGFGVSTLARPALLTERYGTAAFATLTGTLNLPLELVKAGAPLAAAAAAATGHYHAVMIGTGLACAASAACLLLLNRRPAHISALP